MSSTTRGAAGRAAAAILSDVELPGRYHGFIEGNDIPYGTVDVVVTDGFTGNVTLKVVEGVSKLFSQFTREALSSTLLSRLGAMLAFVLNALVVFLHGD